MREEAGTPIQIFPTSTPELFPITMGPKENNHLIEGHATPSHALISKWGKVTKHSIGLGLTKGAPCVYEAAFSLYGVFMLIIVHNLHKNQEEKKKQVLLKSPWQMRKLRHKGIMIFPRSPGELRAEQTLSHSSPNLCSRPSPTPLVLTFIADPGVPKGRRNPRVPRNPWWAHPSLGDSVRKSREEASEKSETLTRTLLLPRTHWPGRWASQWREEPTASCWHLGREASLSMAEVWNGYSLTLGLPSEKEEGGKGHIPPSPCTPPGAKAKPPPATKWTLPPGSFDNQLVPSPVSDSLFCTKCQQRNFLKGITSFNRRTNAFALTE